MNRKAKRAHVARRVSVIPGAAIREHVKLGLYEAGFELVVCPSVAVLPLLEDGPRTVIGGLEPFIAATRVMKRVKTNRGRQCGATGNLDGLLHGLALLLYGNRVSENKDAVGSGPQATLQQEPKGHRGELGIKGMRIPDTRINLRLLHNERCEPPVRMSGEGGDDRVAYGLPIFGRMESVKIGAGFDEPEPEGRERVSERGRVVRPRDAEDKVTGPARGEVQIARFIEMGVEGWHSAGRPKKRPPCLALRPTPMGSFRQGGTFPPNFYSQCIGTEGLCQPAACPGTPAGDRVPVPRSCTMLVQGDETPRTAVRAAMLDPMGAEFTWIDAVCDELRVEFQEPDGGG